MKLRNKLMLGFIRIKLTLLTGINKKKAGEQAFKLFCTPLLKQQYTIRDIFKQAEPLQFSLNGQLIKGYRFNAPQLQKVLILHGFSSTCQNFDKYIMPFINKHYEVLAFDAPAHGESEGKLVNAVDYANMIKKVITLFGPVKRFIAHSFGGIAVCLALEDIVHDAETRLVLIAPATETSSAIDSAFALLGLRNNVLRKAIDDKILSIEGKQTKWYSIRRAIKNIKASVLWIHDEDDDITPVNDALKVKRDDPPNVKFMITKGLGHRRIYKEDLVINEAVNFL